MFLQCSSLHLSYFLQFTAYEIPEFPHAVLHLPPQFLLVLSWACTHAQIFILLMVTTEMKYQDKSVRFTCHPTSVHFVKIGMGSQPYSPDTDNAPSENLVMQSVSILHILLNDILTHYWRHMKERGCTVVCVTCLCECTKMCVGLKVVSFNKGISGRKTIQHTTVILYSDVQCSTSSSSQKIIQCNTIRAADPETSHGGCVCVTGSKLNSIIS